MWRGGIGQVSASDLKPVPLSEIVASTLSKSRVDRASRSSRGGWTAVKEKAASLPWLRFGLCSWGRARRNRSYRRYWTRSADWLRALSTRTPRHKTAVRFGFGPKAQRFCIGRIPTGMLKGARTNAKRRCHSTKRESQEIPTLRTVQNNGTSGIGGKGGFETAINPLRPDGMGPLQGL